MHPMRLIVLTYSRPVFALAATPLTFSASPSFAGACHVGMRTRGGTAGVGKSTTVAVVAGSVLVIAADFFVNQILVTLLY